MDFYAVQLGGLERVHWLPHDVEVEVIDLGREIRNAHHYSNSQLFRVETTITPGR